MFRNLLPAILFTLGTTIIAISGSMPFLGWQVDIIANDFSPGEPYLESLWVTQLDECLDDDEVLRRIGVSWDRFCSFDSELVVSVEQSSEQVANYRYLFFLRKVNVYLWFFFSGIMGMIVAAIYMAVMDIYVDKKPWSGIIVSLIAWTSVCVASTTALVLLGPITSGPHFLWIENCTGSLTLGVSLQKIYSETVAVLVSVIILDVLAVLLMIRGVWVFYRTKAG